MSSKLKIFAFSALIIVFGFVNFSQATPLERVFNIDSNYDYSSRNEIEALLVRPTNKIDFYAEKDWWNNVSEKPQLDSIIYNLSTEFEYKIFPTLTNLYGLPDNWQSNNFRLIVVFHKMKTGYGGYTQVEDNFSKTLYPNSNETEVIFLNSDALNLPSNNLAYYLAHEFTHLLSINLKTKKYNVQDDTWLEELRAEYSETLLGYDQDFQKSVLKKRLESFLYLTNFSLNEWQNTEKDYATVNLLGHYLVEQYGTNILRDSVNSPYKGIESINYALKKNGYNLTFNDIINDWMITNVVNDCSIGPKYCYENPNLARIKVNSETYYLPTKFKSSLSGTDFLKNLSGKWLKLVGGMNAVQIKFNLFQETPISKIPYVILKTNGQKQVGFFDFSSSNISEIYVSKMNDEVEAVYLMPYFIDKNVNNNKIYYYLFEVQSLESNPQTNQQIIQTLTQQILELKRQLAQLELQLAMTKTNQGNPNCSVFSQDLYYSLTSSEVKCLQQFLANFGDSIYPEKLITGYYGPLTMAAVKRYQALKGIMTTGYFGPLTRAAVNQGI